MAYLVRYNPRRELNTWNKVMNRFFDESFRPFWDETENEGPQALALDVSEKDNALHVEAALPGINPDDVDISFEDGVLTIKGETSQETEKEEAGKYYLKERRFGSFHRSIRLPFEVNADEAEATYENGMLYLTLPKAETAMPKKIAVKAG